MSRRLSLLVVIRLGLVLSVALSAVTFGADDAEARRGKVRTVKERATNHDDTSSRRKSDDDHGAQGSDSSGGAYVPRVRRREAAHGSGETATDSGGESAQLGFQITVSAAPVLDDAIFDDGFED